MRSRRTTRGLVLGGGGVLGGAWMVGALTALQDVHGFDARECDVIVGTSVGSIIGALLGAGVSVDHMAAHQRGDPITDGPLAGYSFDYEKATGGSRPKRPKLIGPGSARMILSGIGNVGRMPPTAVLSGFVPAGKGSLARVKAVMASCSIPGWFEPMEIDGRMYVDGGTWSATNADLVTEQGLDEVFVIAPMVSYHFDRPRSLITRLERRWRAQVAKRCLREVEKVRGAGADVTVVGPGPEDLEAIGANLMDLPRRLQVLDTSIKTSTAALRDPENVGPDHLSDVG